MSIMLPNFALTECKLAFFPVESNHILRSLDSGIEGSKIIEEFDPTLKEQVLKSDT